MAWPPNSRVPSSATTASTSPSGRWRAHQGGDAPQGRLLVRERLDLPARMSVGDRGRHQLREVGDPALHAGRERAISPAHRDRAPELALDDDRARERGTGSFLPDDLGHARGRRVVRVESCGPPVRWTSATTKSGSSSRRAPTWCLVVWAPMTVTVPSASKRRTAETSAPASTSTSSQTASDGTP